MIVRIVTGRAGIGTDLATNLIQDAETRPSGNDANRSFGSHK